MTNSVYLRGSNVKRGVVQHSFGLVELGRGSGPVLVMGIEPAGPFAGVLARQETAARRPRCRGVRVAGPRSIHWK